MPPIPSPYARGLVMLRHRLASEQMERNRLAIALVASASARLRELEAAQVDAPKQETGPALTDPASVPTPIPARDRNRSGCYTECA
jgi:hypothetical protein